MDYQQKRWEVEVVVCVVRAVCPLRNFTVIFLFEVISNLALIISPELQIIF